MIFVDGWVECSGTVRGQRMLAAADSRSSGLVGGSTPWQEFIALAPFDLAASEVSVKLFGLAGGPKSHAPFAGRGIPLDASTSVRLAYELPVGVADDGDFGHTYALYSEVKPLLATIESLAEWAPVCRLLDSIVLQGFSADGLRLVVWANW